MEKCEKKVKALLLAMSLMFVIGIANAVPMIDIRNRPTLEFGIQRNFGGKHDYDYDYSFDNMNIKRTAKAMGSHAEMVLYGKISFQV